MQIWLLDEDPYKCTSLLTNRLVTKMLVEQLQLLSTYYRKQGMCNDFLYKEIPQGKELVEFISDHIDWNLHYLNALVKECFKRFGNKANLYKSVSVARKLLSAFNIIKSTENIKLNYISFRCKKEYLLHKEYNKKKLPIKQGVALYKQYYDWNINLKNILHV